jgi:hypothetical protein
MRNIYSQQGRVQATKDNNGGARTVSDKELLKAAQEISAGRKMIITTLEKFFVRIPDRSGLAALASAEACTPCGMYSCKETSDGRCPARLTPGLLIALQCGLPVRVRSNPCEETKNTSNGAVVPRPCQNQFDGVIPVAAYARAEGRRRPHNYVIIRSEHRARAPRTPAVGLEL